MKIAWVTPATRNTSITEFSVTVTAQLSQFCVVDFLTFDQDWTPDVQALQVNKRDISRPGEVAWADYDHIVFNLGNNWENHGKIIELSLNHAGVVILHDASMHHVVAYYTNEILKDRTTYANFMVGKYGAKGAMALRESLIQTADPIFAPWDARMGPDFGFIDFFAAGHYGVVAHSEYTFSKMFDERIPRLVSRLPGDEKGTWEMAEVEAWQARFRTNPSIRFCVMGYLNDAKNIPTAIEIISELNRRGLDCELLVLGGDKGGYHQKLIEHAKRHNVLNRVEFALNLDRAQFNLQKSRVDVHLSIRYPNYEGCSAAAFESLQTGRPLMSLRSGAFAEIPADAAVFFEGFDAAKIAQTILRKCQDREGLIAMGLRGRACSLSVSAASYAESLFAFLRSLDKNSRVVTALPGIKAHQVDNGFFAPEYSFYSDDAAENIAMLMAIEPFGSLLENPDALIYLRELFVLDPEAYWDVLGFLKSVLTGRLDVFFPMMAVVDEESLRRIGEFCALLDDKQFLHAWQRLHEQKKAVA